MYIHRESCCIVHFSLWLQPKNIWKPLAITYHEAFDLYELSFHGFPT